MANILDPSPLKVATNQKAFKLHLNISNICKATFMLAITLFGLITWAQVPGANLPANETALAIEQRSRLLDVTRLKHVEASTLTFLAARIFSTWDQTKLPSERTSTTKLESEQMKLRLQYLLNHLIQKRKIFQLSRSVKIDLANKAHLCKMNSVSKSESCDHMHGVYFPILNMIFLDTDASYEVQTRSLLHELIHAYQYTFRFFADAQIFRNSLSSNAEDFSSPKGVASWTQFQIYFYEAQANWKGMLYSPPKSWTDFFKVDELRPKGPLSPSEVTRTWRNPEVGRESTFYLPSVFINSEDKMKVQSPYRDSHFELPELISVDQRLWSKLNTYHSGIQFDLRPHEIFTSALERTYYGKLPFLFDLGFSDLKLFNQVHQDYFKGLGSFELLRRNLTGPRPSLEFADTDCKQLFDQLMDGTSSPLVRWTQIDDSVITKCKPYSADPTRQKRQQIFQEYLQQTDMKRLLQLRRRGGEGVGTPALQVSPNYGIQPQLEIHPPEFN